MQIDASAYADQLAYYEVYAAQNRYSTKLSTLQNQSSMISKIDNALDALDNLEVDPDGWTHKLIS